jgi:hypothetical protein
MTNLFDPPKVYELPLSKGADLFVVFIYKPLLTDENGDPILDENGQRQYVETDYPAGSNVRLRIEHPDEDGSDLKFNATIEGSRATVHEDFAVADLIPKGVLWAVNVNFDDHDVVMCNGKTVRYDGATK